MLLRRLRGRAPRAGRAAPPENYGRDPPGARLEELLEAIHGLVAALGDHGLHDLGHLPPEGLG